MNTKYNKEQLSSQLFSEDEFNKIQNSILSDIEYIYLSSNSTLSQSQIEYLFLKNIDSVNINLLRNRNCPQIKILEFIQLNDKIYNIAIAHNLSISQDIIKRLISFNDSDVDISLRFNNLI